MTHQDNESFSQITKLKLQVVNQLTEHFKKCIELKYALKVNDLRFLVSLADFIDKNNDAKLLDFYNKFFGPGTPLGDKIIVSMTTFGINDHSQDKESKDIYNAHLALQQLGPKIQQIEDDKKEVALGSIDAIEKYVSHLHNNLLNLAQLEMALTSIIQTPKISNKNELKEFREAVSKTIKEVSDKLTDPNGFMGITMKNPEDRKAQFELFLQSKEFQSMNYAIADIKYKFTNQLNQYVQKNESKLTQLFPPERGNVYTQLRNLSGFTKLESNKEFNHILEHVGIDKKVIQKVNDISSYMDGMISTRALIDSRKLAKNWRRADKYNATQIEKMANSIMLGLDPDMGFSEPLKKKYGENYNAYVSGCIEECLTHIQRVEFKRDNDGLLKPQVRNEGKMNLIQRALGVKVLEGEEKKNYDKTGTRADTGYVDITKFNTQSLEDLYQGSKNTTKGKFGSTKIVYRILAAIKPVDIKDPHRISHDEAEALSDKVSRIQKMIKKNESR